MFAHAVAVTPDIDQVTVVQYPVDQRSSHDFVSEDFSPFLEPFVGGQYGGSAFVAPIHQLEEQYRTGVIDRQIPDLIDYQERRVGQHRQPPGELSGGLGFFQGGDQIYQGSVVDAPASLRSGNGQTDCEVGFTDARRPQKDDIFLALDKSELMQALDLLRDRVRVGVGWSRVGVRLGSGMGLGLGLTSGQG